MTLEDGTFSYTTGANIIVILTIMVGAYTRSHFRIT